MPSVQLDIAGPAKDQLEILQSVVVTRKATLTRFVGADNKPQEGLLLKKLDVLVSTCSEFPKLSPIQRASFTNLICQISSTVEKAKNDLVNALQEISDKYAELSVTEDQEPVLTQIIMQCDAALVRAHERINIFYNIIKDKFLNTGIDITPLLDLELYLSRVRCL